MTKDEYCINVCGAKCCTHSCGRVCPHLRDDKKCAIYAERFADDQPDDQLVAITQSATSGDPTLISFICTRIEVLIRDNRLPKAIADQCCYAHLELLLCDH